MPFRLFDPLYVFHRLVERNECDIRALEELGNEIKDAKYELMESRNNDTTKLQKAYRRFSEISSNASERAQRVVRVYKFLSQEVSRILDPKFLKKYRECDEETIKEILRKAQDNQTRFFEAVGNIHPEFLREMAERSNDSPETLAHHQRIIEKESRKIMYG